MTSPAPPTTPSHPIPPNPATAPALTNHTHPPIPFTFPTHTSPPPPLTATTQRRDREKRAARRARQRARDVAREDEEDSFMDDLQRAVGELKVRLGSCVRAWCLRPRRCLVSVSVVRAIVLGLTSVLALDIFSDLIVVALPSLIPCVLPVFSLCSPCVLPVFSLRSPPVPLASALHVTAGGGGGLHVSGPVGGRQIDVATLRA